MWAADTPWESRLARELGPGEAWTRSFRGTAAPGEAQGDHGHSLAVVRRRPAWPPALPEPWRVFSEQWASGAAPLPVRRPHSAWGAPGPREPSPHTPLRLPLPQHLRIPPRGPSRFGVPVRAGLRPPLPQGSTLMMQRL